MVGVVARLIVPLRPETLDEGFLRPALDVQGALLDTLDYLIALDERLLRFPDGFVRRLNAFVDDCGDLPFVLAVLRQLVAWGIGLGSENSPNANEMFRLLLAQKAIDVND